MEKIMKKLLLLAALCAFTVNAFGMNHQFQMHMPAEFAQQMMLPGQNKPNGTRLILAGLGCVGISMWYASRKDNSQQLVTHLTVTGGGIIDNNSINISPRAIGALAPLIPAIFCFWYGFKNLNS